METDEKATSFFVKKGDFFYFFREKSDRLHNRIRETGHRYGNIDKIIKRKKKCLTFSL